MAAAHLSRLRARMTPPALRPEPSGPAGGREVERVLALATRLFDVASAALVVAGPEGLRVAGSPAVPGWAEREAIDATRRLLEALAAAPGGGVQGGGVLEQVTADRGYGAASPVLTGSGRCLGAICLLDPERRALMSALQRRLFGEFGGLLASALAPPAAATGATALQDVADAEPEAFALFDLDGRRLLSNRRFDALLGACLPPGAAPAEAQGDEAAWLASRLARETAPVGVYHTARPDGTWLVVEERRGRHGRSLVARVEARDVGDGAAAA